MWLVLLLYKGLYNHIFIGVLRISNIITYPIAGFVIGNTNEDNDRYALYKTINRIYLTTISQVERITDWIDEILEPEDENHSDS